MQKNTVTTINLKIHHRCNIYFGKEFKKWTIRKNILYQKDPSYFLGKTTVMVLDFGLTGGPTKKEKSFSISNHKLDGIKQKSRKTKSRRASYHDYEHDSDSSSSSEADDSYCSDTECGSTFSRRTPYPKFREKIVAISQKSGSLSTHDTAIAASKTEAKSSAAIASMIEFEAIEDEILSAYKNYKQQEQKQIRNK